MYITISYQNEIRIKNIIVDTEYVESTLQKTWKVNFHFIKTEKFHVGGLEFIYGGREEAAIGWTYILHRLESQKNVFVTLIITEGNKLNITLDFRDLKIKINTVHSNFNQLELADIIDHADFPYVDSVIHISSKYYYQSGKNELLEFYLHEDGTMKSTIIAHANRFDNDGFQLMPPPELPTF